MLKMLSVPNATWSMNDSRQPIRPSMDRKLSHLGFGRSRPHRRTRDRRSSARWPCTACPNTDPLLPPRQSASRPGSGP